MTVRRIPSAETRPVRHRVLWPHRPDVASCTIDIDDAPDALHFGAFSPAAEIHGREAFTVEDGMRVAQMVVAQYSQFEWESVEDLDETARGAGGFGSTGKQ